MVSINSIILDSSSAKRPPLVMLHGWNRSADDLYPLAELLSPYMKVHALDLPGFGSSDLPDGDWDTQQYADRILKYLDDNSLTKVNLFGHSFGGRISIRLASAQPDKIENLILTGSHGLKRKRTTLEELRVRGIPKLGKIVKMIDKFSGLKLYQDKFIPRFGSKDYQAAGALRGTLVKTVKEDQTEQARKIKTPTLLLWGEDDTETPLEMGIRFNQLISGSRLIAFPFRGHDIFQDIDSHLTAYYMIQFLCGSSLSTQNDGASLDLAGTNNV